MRAISLAGWFVILPMFVLQVHANILPNWFSISQKHASYDYQISANFWEIAISLSGRVQKYTEDLLHSAAASSQDVAEKIEHVKGTMKQVVTAVGTLRADVQDAAEAHGKNLDEVSDELTILFATILEYIKAEFPSPDKAPSHEERKLMVSSVMTKVEEAIVHLGGQYGMSEESLRAHIDNISPHVVLLVILTGDIIEQHPVLLETLLFSVAILLIPESWFLRPLLSLFGFGPEGPVKGTAAAWIQRRFWGAAVAPGSWFARLQSAGMKVRLPPGTGRTIVGGIGAGVAIALTGLGCRR